MSINFRRAAKQITGSAYLLFDDVCGYQHAFCLIKGLFDIDATLNTAKRMEYDIVL